MQVLVYSRPGEGDDCDCGHYEYAGSFFPDGVADLKAVDTATRERWAAMFDCFQVVLFVGVGSDAVEHRRTWEV